MSGSPSTLNDHRALVCTKCWEELFSHDQLWAQLDRPFHGRSNVVLHTTIAELSSSAQPPTNCNFCQLALHSIHTRVRASPHMPSLTMLTLEPNSPLVIRLNGWKEQGFGVFKLVVSKYGSSYAMDSFVLNWGEDSNHVYRTDPASGRDMNLDIGRPESFELAKCWLDECTNTTQHTDCPPYEAMPLPTRVVDVGTVDNPNQPPRLFTTHDFVAPYAALSYCWGQPDQWTTTRANITELTTGAGIDLASVSATISDAIIATRRMGLRYLWVDALCIIQDDEEDKRAEISRMRDVYKNAYCTLVVESAADAADGFLYKQPDPGFPIYHLPFARLENGEYCYEAVYLRPEAAYKYEPQEAVINSRAWTLEERLLSRRKLLYTQKQLRWECQSRKYQDGGLPPPSSPRVNTGRDPTFLQPLYKILDEKEIETPWSPINFEVPVQGQEKLKRFWHLLVSDYTTRDCTNPLDKVRAFGGIAAEFQRVFLEDKYLAGFWKDMLIEDLLWCRHGDATAQPRPVKYRAPSWSWAAIDGEILTGFLTKGEIVQSFKVLDVETTLRSKNSPFGEVKKAKLTVRGYMRHGSLAYDESARHNKYTMGDFESGDERRWNASLDALEDSKEETMWCLWVAETANQIMGLILVPDRGEEGTFRRVGVFTSRESVYGLNKIDDVERDWFRQGGEKMAIIIV